VLRPAAADRTLMPKLVSPQPARPLSAVVLPEQLPAGSAPVPDAALLLAHRTPLAEHPVSADGKATAVLTTLGIMFTVLTRYAGTLGDVIHEDAWARWPVIALIGAFVVLSFGAVLQAFRTLSPRFPKAEPSLAFFGDIARLGRDEYVARVEGLTEADALDHVLRYNHTNAVICVAKFKQMRRCVRLFQYVFACWLILVLVVTYRSLT